MQVGVAALAGGREIQCQRRDGRAGQCRRQQRKVQLVAAHRRIPSRIGAAIEHQHRVQRLRRATGQRHFHMRQITARDQADRGRSPTARCRQHCSDGDVGVVILGRDVAALGSEIAHVAVHDQFARLELAVGDLDATTHAADVDHRLVGLADAETVDGDHIGLDRQRHLDLRQRIRPRRQLERLIALGQVERGVGQFQLVQQQLAAQQRAQVRLQVRALGVEMDVVVAEVDVVEGQRPGHRAVDLVPGEAGTHRQARHHLRQQHVAAGHRLQQPVHGQQGDQHQADHARAGPCPEAATTVEAHAPRRRVRRRSRCGRAHRSAPMLRYSWNCESGLFRPCAISTRTGPTGDFQRTPKPTPVCRSMLVSKALPVSTNTAAPHGPPLK
ncbi:hypothetical protein D3C72_1236630 [compost metagenome]